MDKKALTCIVCPMGCRMRAETENDKLKTLRGNACKRGEAYAVQELFDPRRTLTTTVKVQNITSCLVAVKTESPVPKALLMPCMEVLRRVRVTTPVSIGDVIVADILATGVPVIACAEVDYRH